MVLRHCCFWTKLFLRYLFICCDIIHKKQIKQSFKFYFTFTFIENISRIKENEMLTTMDYNRKPVTILADFLVLFISNYYKLKFVSKKHTFLYDFQFIHCLNNERPF